MKLCDKSVLEHVINRVKKTKIISDIIIATTLNKKDIEIVQLCAEIGVRCFCGSEEDVLDRFYQACKSINPKNIIRITSDCPVIDPEVITKVLKKHIKEKADYTSNTLKETYPDGQDVEVFKFEVLEKAWLNAKLKSEREHVTPYIRNNPKMFKHINVLYKENLGDKRWTLDNKEDYEFLTEVFNSLYHVNQFFGMLEIIKLLKEKPELEQINKNIARNEGYIKSLKEDKLV